jgi:hypothetical protein
MPQSGRMTERVLSRSAMPGDHFAARHPAHFKLSKNTADNPAQCPHNTMPVYRPLFVRRIKIRPIPEKLEITQTATNHTSRKNFTGQSAQIQ